MLYQYYCVEIIKTAGGEFEHHVYWLYDEDDTKALLKCEAKYHEILSAAAVSLNAEHAAIMFTSQGVPLRNQCYVH